MSKCSCQDWNKIVSDHKNLFQIRETYGWIISWIEISKEKNHHKVNKYGVAIQYCPFCGKKLRDEN